MLTRAVAVVVVAMRGAVFAHPVAPRVDAALERRFHAEVAAVSAAAATAYDEGNAAREAGRFEEAIVAYREAIELAPTIDHPRRRLCSVYQRMQRLDDALAACEQALALAPASPYDQGALAALLLSRDATGDVERAVRLASDAAGVLTEDVWTLRIWCDALMQHAELPRMRGCARRLRAIDPDGAAANYFAAVIAIEDRDHDEALARLVAARQAGLARAMVDELSHKLAGIGHAPPPIAQAEPPAEALVPDATRATDAGRWIAVAAFVTLVVVAATVVALTRGQIRARRRRRRRAGTRPA